MKHFVFAIFLHSRCEPIGAAADRRVSAHGADALRKRCIGAALFD
ncbi:MAG TPA: hypothetical protein VJ486_13190 [Geothrix sp.]|nr:hypothetical protein [Geothrix sp.]